MDSKYEELIQKNGHKEIIKKLLNESNINKLNYDSLFDSILIYFDGHIEKNLPNYIKEKDKSFAMDNWIKENIDKLENNSSICIKNVFKKIEKSKSNIFDLFENIDEIFNKLEKN